MRAETVYIITIGTDTESTQVAAGLYHKYGRPATNAAVIRGDNEDSYVLNNMKHGQLPLREGIQGQAPSTNFRNAWNAVKNVPSREAGQARFDVGVYIVVHGYGLGAWIDSPTDLVGAMTAVIPDEVFTRIGKITLVMCLAIDNDARNVNGTPLPENPDSSILQFLQLLSENGCRPQVAAWDTQVTAAPAVAGNIGQKFIKPTNDQPYAPAKPLREQHKTIFKLNDQGVVIAGPPSAFAQQ